MGRIIQATGDAKPPEPGKPAVLQGKVSLTGDWFTQTLQFRQAMADLRRQQQFNPNMGLDPIATLSAVSQMMAGAAIEIRRLQVALRYVTEKAGIELPSIDELAQAENKGEPDGNGDATGKVQAATPATPATESEDDGD